MNMKHLAFMACILFACSANHNTRVVTPTSNDTVFVDGKNDGLQRNERSDYQRCLEEEGHYAKESETANPFALSTCNQLFGGQ